jgi:hypothetical protein
MVELRDRLEHVFSVKLAEHVIASAVTPVDLLDSIMAARRGRSPPGPASRGVGGIHRPAGEAWPETADTLAEALAWHADTHPDVTTVRIVTGDGSVEDISTGR